MTLADFRPVHVKLERRDDDVVIATLIREQLSEEENIEELGHELVALVDQFHCLKVVLNLAQVEYVSSSGLGKMITLHRKLHRKNGQLVICGAAGAVHDVFRSSRLINYFRIVDSVDDALAAFAA